ncbi:MAG: hypothetical protein VX246_15700 [Myxococcota bacterium]|nr:hypothetical protein [Myxococcota bacterium]
MLTELMPEQARIVAIVYVASLVPLGVVTTQWFRGRLPRWIAAIYVATFFCCALGWELWFNYGWVDGAAVDARRFPALNAWIPLHVNWLLNSLGDAGCVGLGGILLAHFAQRKRAVDPFDSWRWSTFAVLLVWFLAQNLWIELRVYYAQLAPGFDLSWAPLAPTGRFFNPVLFELGGRSVQLQTQLPWLLMTPIFYALAIRLRKRFGDEMC